MRVTTPLTLVELVELLLDVEPLLREPVEAPPPLALLEGLGLGVGVPLLDGVGVGVGVLLLDGVGVGEEVPVALLEGVGVGLATVLIAA